MKTYFTNLTPHAINEVTTGQTFPPSGISARVATTSEEVEVVDGIPFNKTQFGEVAGLPDPTPNVIYIVSGLVKSAVDRSDVVSPSTLVRDEGGNIIGCRGFNV